MGMSLLRSLALIQLLICCWSQLTRGLTPPVVVCNGEDNTECSVYNYLGEFTDRSACRAAKVVYPTTEEELVAAIAEGVRNGQKMRVVSKGSHSIPKLVCPGGNGTGLLISTRYYNQNIIVNPADQTATVDAGVQLKPFLEKVASYGLTFPHLPYWAGLSISGLLGTGVHGSGIWGKGSAVYEYVTEIRLVVPASAEEGYAKVINLVAGANDEILNAAKVSLGALGVISTVTLELEPQFKRSLTYLQTSDSDLETQVELSAQQNEFGDVTWYPSLKLAFYRRDNRVPVSTPGEGVNNYNGFQPQPVTVRVGSRDREETYEAEGAAEAKCATAAALATGLMRMGNGFLNDGHVFTGYPVVGFHSSIVTSGSCDDTTQPGFGCLWDKTTKGTYYFQTTFSISFANVPAFISDVKALVALNPDGLCGLGLYAGVLMRHVKQSSGAYLGEVEDGVDMDFTYYRSYDPRTPRLFQDVMEEIEQMLLFKYNAKPHWGKNRNVAFATSRSLYNNLSRFIEVKNQLDPHGLFSNEWTDTVLDVGGAAANLQKFEPYCALEGNCICSEDIHCAPESSLLCRPGLVYKEARVCRKIADQICREIPDQVHSSFM